MNENIPVIKIEEDNLPRAWEKSILATWTEGIEIKTEYDKKKEFSSKDCTMIIVIRNPLTEPRIHRAFPGGLEDLEIYRQEVVDGIHDHWINPDEGKWTYTYHQRLFNFKYDQNAGNRKENPDKEPINQMQYLINKLSKKIYSRRAQAITWNPKFDPQTDDPPCLQRIWCRITNPSDNKYFLNMNTHWRSRDAYKAAFMNMFAFTDLQKLIAKEISLKTNLSIGIGRYVDISDSYHIYGAYKEEVESFIKIVQKRSFDDRTWETKFAQPFFTDANKNKSYSG